MTARSAKTRIAAKILWSAVIGGLCALPLASQSPATAANNVEDPLSGISRAAISQANSFVLARNGQAFFYNYDAGVVGRPFLRDVYKSFGFSFDAQYFLYLKANGRFPTFALYSRDLASGRERQITDAPVHYAAWSPAGPVMAYLWLDKSNRFHVSTYDLASGAGSEIGSGQLRSDFLEWSVDGSELMYMEAVPLSNRAAEEGRYSYTVRRYSLRSRSEAAVAAADWAQFAGNQLVVLSSRATLPYRTIPNPKRESFRRFAMSGGQIYADSEEAGRPVVKRWNPSANSFDVAARGQIYLHNARGVVTREFTSTGIEFQYLPNDALQPMGQIPSSSITWKIPFQGLAAVVQGGASYQDGSCDGALCFVTAHGGALGYAIDWQQMPDLRQGDGHVLATADGTVAATANNITCNTASPTCFVGWDDYNPSCPADNSGAGNFVVVAHLDGTYSLNAHLKSGSVQVVAGQNVSQGAYLADQGHSGVAAAYNNYLSCGDHLHFSRQIGPGIWDQSVPTDFTETPCLLGCGAPYASANVELAPAPVLGAVTPSTWVAGSNVQVTLTGQNLTYGSTVAIGGSGVAVSGVSVLSASRMIATLTIAPGTAAGAHNLTVTSANGTSNPAVFSVIPAGAGGTLSGTAATPSGTQQLTALGASDWAHWGLSTVISYNHKAAVVPQIGDFTIVGNTAVGRYSTTPVGYSWTDGTPANSASGSTTGVYVSGQNNGFRITVPADLAARTLTVYVGVSGAQGQMRAQLSDGSAPDYVDSSLSNGGGLSTGVYSITYNAASPGQTLVVTFTEASAGGSVSLQAAALSGGSGAPDFALSAPPAVEVVAGAASTQTVGVAALGGFNGSVAFSVSGLPPGATAGFNPATVSGGGSTALTVTAPAGTIPATYPITITATSGSLNHTANLNLAITDFSVAAATAARTVIAGGSVTYTLAAVAPIGTPGTVSFSASGLPAGLGAVFNPAPASFNSPVIMTVTAAGGVAPGSYAFTITATSGGSSHTAAVTVTVTAAQSGGSLSASVAAPSGPVPLTTQGTLDWAHWGLAATNSFDHKANVTQQISNFTIVGAGASHRYGNNSVGFTWTDGTPNTSITNSTTGVYSLGQGIGFSITAPADTTLRTLKVYVGAFRAQGRMVAQLSDGSAADYVDTSVINTAGVTTLGVYTFVYSAASSGQTLTVTYIQDSPSLLGNVTLQAATLSGGPDFSITPTPGARSVAAGGGASFTIGVSALSGFAGTVGLTVSGLPAGVTAGFSPNTVTGSGSSTLTLSTTSGAAAGSYPVTVTASSGNLSHTTNVILVVTAPAGGGTLGGSMATPVGPIQLTTEGSSDWAHWGLTAVTDFDHKAAVAQQITNYVRVGSASPSRYANNAAGFTWTDGTPTGAASNSTTGIYISGQNNGFQIMAPADTALRTLKVYVGAWRTQGQFQAHLSDGSAVDYVDTSLSNNAGVTTLGVYTLTYNAATSGQMLIVTYTGSTSLGNVTLQAATLSGGVVMPDYTLGATPAGQSVVAGDSALYTATIAALNGFADSVAFAVSGLPASVTADFTPTTVVGSGSSTLTLSTTSGTAVGSYPLTVTATSGSLSHTANITLTVTGPPDYTVNAIPASQSVAAGGGAPYTVSVAAVNGFAGAVGFTVSGLPAGVTAGFSPNTVTGSGSSTLTLSTTSGAAVGSYPLTVTATSGSLSHTTSITLVITSAPAFTVSASPSSQNVAAGSSAPYTMTIAALNGFSGSVGFTVSGLPAGVTAGFSPNTVTGSGSSTLTLSTTSATVAGSYPLTVTATSGSLSHTANITLVVTAAPDFAVSASPSSQNVVAGGNAPYTMSIAALNGFSGSVGFTVSGLPAGVTAGFSPNTVTGSGSSTLTLSTTSATVAGSYPLTVTATSGSLSHTADITIVVTAAPDFTVSATPSSRTVLAGGSAPYTLTIGALNGFVGNVGFTLSGLPAGATAGFSPTTVTGSGSSTLTLSTTSGTAAGTYPLTVTAASGSLNHTANITLSVTVPAGGGFLGGAMATPTGPIQLTTEGTSDWAHWGLNTVTDFDHKAAVTQQIANYVKVGTASPSRYANNAIGFTWTDGQPTATATNSPTGVFITGQNNGFQLMLPADTTARTLKVYVGAWRSQGSLVAHLSDGSAPDYVDTSLSNSTGVTTLGVYTLAYSAAASGQTLTVTYTGNAAPGNVTLQAATLSGGSVAPDYTVSATPSSQSVAAGNSAPYTATIGALNGFSGSVALSVSGLPAGATAGFSPTTVTGSGSSILTLSTTATTVPGTYPVVITATSGSLSHTANISLTVTAAPGSGTLTGSMAAPVGPIQLTSEGVLDWAHWGVNAASDFDHKTGVAQQISNYTVIGTGVPARYPNNSVGFTWTDGAPNATATNSTTGLYITGLNQGFRVSVPADTTPRTLRVYVGAWRAQGNLVAHLSDGSAVDYADSSLTNTSGVTSLGVYTLTYRAASAGQMLTITFTQQTSSTGNVTLQAATLAP